MNTFFTKFSIKTLYISFAVAAIALVSACGKSDTEIPNIGSLSVYNTSPTLSSYDVYINGSRFNAAALPYAGGVKYTQLTEGTYEAKFTVSGETTSIYTKSNIAVGNNSFYTLYLTGTSGNFDGLLITDDFSNTSTEKAYVRFINLSPDAPALDLGIKDATTSLATNKAYKTYSGFVAVDPGAKVLEIKLNNGGTVKASIDKTLVKNTFYTVIAGGKVTPSTDLERQFNGQVIQHQ
ncbi:DUF4397 domain-containing protein [Nubsella zeaxanthinifaciens]|uniref:DUF4397 domain-containing protein n=1 Tax=Nubsella zeaxanthinifaciens TaxID=392412 RepID=UPI000DE42EE2|nr:DUF4397 domain-containing protein [Nubsella zeaxanthinifaciens]